MSAEDESSVVGSDKDPSSIAVASTSIVNSRSRSVNSHEEHEGNIFSSDGGTSISSETTVSEPPTVSRDNIDEAVLGGEFELSSSGTPSAARYQTPMKNSTRLGSVETDFLPPFVSSISEITIPEDKKVEEGLEVSDPAVEDAEPPPLAGTNVMNVILVAAECAPWSKTGICLSEIHGSILSLCKIG